MKYSKTAPQTPLGPNLCNSNPAPSLGKWTGGRKVVKNTLFSTSERSMQKPYKIGLLGRLSHLNEMDILSLTAPLEPFLLQLYWQISPNFQKMLAESAFL